MLISRRDRLNQSNGRMRILTDERHREIALSGAYRVDHLDRIYSCLRCVQPSYRQCPTRHFIFVSVWTMSRRRRASLYRPTTHAPSTDWKNAQPSKRAVDRERHLPASFAYARSRDVTSRHVTDHQTVPHTASASASRLWRSADGTRISENFRATPHDTLLTYGLDLHVEKNDGLKNERVDFRRRS